MSLHIMFHDLSNSPDPHRYMEKKLAAFFPKELISDESLPTLVMKSYAAGPGPEVPTASGDQLPKLGEDKNSQMLKKEISLFSRLVNKFSPLIEGETMEPDSDVFTFLTAPFRDYPAGTPVLKRTTNQAALYYFYNCAQVKDGFFSYVPQTEETLPNRNILNGFPDQGGVSNSIWAELLCGFVKSIVGAAGSHIGSMAIEAIFPSGKSIDYKSLLDDFSKIIANANKIQTISEQGGKLNGITQSHGEYYAPRRPVASKEELYRQLLDYHNRLRDICGILSYKNGTDYTQEGLPVYVAAVSFLLAIYQEMALQDPSAASPAASSNIQSIKYLSKNASSYAEGKCNEIFNQKLNARLDKISGVCSNPYCDDRVCKNRYYFRDAETGYFSGYYEQSGCKDKPEDRCSAARATYYANRKNEKTNSLNEQLDWMKKIAADWKLLESKPLPK